MDVRLPDGTIIRNVPEGTTKAQLMAKLQMSAPAEPPVEPERGFLEQLPRQLGLTLRAPINAALSIPAMLGDVVTGGRSTPAVNRVLDSVFPSPANAPERIAQDVAGGMTGGAGIAKLTKTMATALPQILAAGGGALGSGGAREAGFGPTGQIVSGVLGGVVAPSAATAAVEGGKAAARGARALVDPFTEHGRRNIVARTMQAQAKDPRMAAESIANAPEFVPGSVPTTAEASGDVGLAALQKQIRNQRPTDFADHATAQDAARQAFLQRAFGGQSELDAAKAAREAATRDLRERSLAAANQTGETVGELNQSIRQAAEAKARALQDYGQMRSGAARQQILADDFTPIPGMPRVPSRVSPNAERVPEFASGANEAATIAAQRETQRQVLQAQLDAIPHKPLYTEPIIGNITGTLNVPGKRSSDVIRKTLGEVREKISGFTRDDGTIDARDLYTIRKELGATIGKYAADEKNWDKRLTAGLEKDIQRQIDNAILKSGGTDWFKYLKEYRDRSAKIEAMETGQEITRKSLNPNTERLSPAQFARQFSDRAEDIAGMGARGSDALTRVNRDLRRSVAPDNAMRTPGSDTLQNLVGANAIQSMTGLGGMHAGPVSKMAGGLLGKVYGPLESQTQDLMVRAMLDKNLGAGLLTQQLAENPKLREELIRRMLMLPSAGLLGTGIAQ